MFKNYIFTIVISLITIFYTNISMALKREMFIFMKRDDIEEGMNQLAKVVVGLMQFVYTDQKILRLMQPNNKPQPRKVALVTETSNTKKSVRRVVIPNFMLN